MKTKSMGLGQMIGYGMLVVLFTLFHTNVFASTIVCETAYGERSFDIQDQSITFHKESHEEGRSISSVSVQQVRTEKKHRGFTKILYKDGFKHRIHIKQTDSFSELDDYMVITSPKGHEMTYPLSCHNA